MSLVSQITALVTRIGEEVKLKLPILNPVASESLTVDHGSGEAKVTVDSSTGNWATFYFKNEGDELFDFGANASTFAIGRYPTAGGVETVMEVIKDTGVVKIYGTTEIPAVKITGGSPGVGKVLVSDADGDATWQTPDVTQAELDAKVTQVITNGVTTTAPSEDAVFDALALKAPLASPALTGNPTAPTASPGDNDTSIATTAFVTAADTALIIDSIADSDTTHAPSRNAVFDALALKAAITYVDGKVTQVITNGVTTTAPSEDAVFDALALKAPLASPALTGNPTAPTQTAADNSTKLATTAYTDAKVAETITNGVTGIAPSQDAVFDALALKAPLASPALSGTPTAPTASAATNNTQIATTAYADAKVADSITDAVTGIAPSQNAVFDALVLKAPLASPALTGTPTAPTASAATNNTQVATTAYADAKVADAINDGTTGIAPSQNAVFDALAGKLSATAPTVTSPLTVDPNAGTGDAYAYLKGAASTDTAALFLQTGSNARWAIGKNATAEAGSDAGSNLAISRFNDAGTYVDDPISIVRSTGVVTAKGLVSSSTSTVTDAVVITQAGYNALGGGRPSTKFYIIVG